jgi:predicted O-methyltransferase YrrM
LPLNEYNLRMLEQTWSAVDRYIADCLVREDETLRAARAASDAAGLPAGSITPSQGKLLELLVRVRGARRVLELGTLGGYSTIWLARGLPRDGRLVTLERDPAYAQVARANLERAGFRDRVEVRVGPALQTLPQLAAEDAGPFDLVFIDADKQHNPEYLDWSVRLSHDGTLIVADKVIRAGAILDPNGEDPRLGDGGVHGLRRFYQQIAADQRLSATAIQTVGEKGHDGLALVLVQAVTRDAS